ncbi:MAG: hypothetical protein V2B13_12810, partial [Pseudomonadota bacterium]
KKSTCPAYRGIALHPSPLFSGAGLLRRTSKYASLLRSSFASWGCWVAILSGWFPVCAPCIWDFLLCRLFDDFLRDHQSSFKRRFGVRNYF